jgi:DNA (cytosine-5)-methyltransferase 1
VERFVDDEKEYRYISLFAGVEAASVAWHPLGWKPVAFAEFDEFPSEVLAQRFPDVPNLGDVTKVDWNEWKEKEIDVIIGGSPCQSFSVAGKRLGLDDSRGNLAIEFCRIIDTVRPRWFIFENVAGLLSSDEGRDFATLISLMGECGYGVAYRILDAQHFGVPQRRRRLFVVGHIREDWRRSASVLFERESLSRNTTQTQRKRTQANAKNLERSIEETIEDFDRRRMKPIGIESSQKVAEDDSDYLAFQTLRDNENNLNVTIQQDQTGTIATTQDERKTSTIIAQKAWAWNDEKQVRLQGGHGDIAGTVATQSQSHGATMIAEPDVSESNNIEVKPASIRRRKINPDTGKRDDYNSDIENTKRIEIADGDVSNTLTTITNDSLVSLNSQTDNTLMIVRRLTPIECERLQGFPDNWTQISWKGKPPKQCPDGHRYKAMGNSMAVPVIQWLGEGIMAADKIPESPLPVESTNRLSSFQDGVATSTSDLDSWFS